MAFLMNGARHMQKDMFLNRARQMKCKRHTFATRGWIAKKGTDGIILAAQTDSSPAIQILHCLRMFAAPTCVISGRNRS